MMRLYLGARMTVFPTLYLGLFGRGSVVSFVGKSVGIDIYKKICFFGGWWWWW